MALRGVLAGGSPAATHFLCFAKESKQRKATPTVCVPFAALRGSLWCALQAGSAQTRLRLKQCAALIRLKLCSSAQTQGVGEEQPNSRTAEPQNTEVPGYWLGVLSVVSDPDSPVLAGPVMCQKSGIRAAHCLSAASLGGPPLFGCSAGCPKRSAGTRTAGRLFFGYFLLAKQK